jgi:glycosyltransferase involved in cell wall biosynthesis
MTTPPSNNPYPADWKNLRTVLGHDWLTGMRGGERVLELLCDGFPGAPILTLLHHAEAISGRINSHPVRTSCLQRIPGIHRHYRHLLPLFPLAVRTLKTPPADLLITSSHCVIKGLNRPAGGRHLCYCFTPMRYAWLFFDVYFGGRARRAAAAPLLALLRAWDRRANAGVDHFVGISRHVQDRIQRFYGRESDLVYPPVNTAHWTPDGKPPGDFDLIVSALVPYKRLDVAVGAYSRAGRKLKIVGIGGESDRLKAMAGPTVEFLGRLPDSDILALYRRCRALVFPGEEDFGIVPVEAQACGRPVIALARGGAMETVRDGVSGVLFKDQTEASLLEAVEKCGDLTWDAEAIRAQAEQFSEARFIAGMADSIRRCLNA